MLVLAVESGQALRASDALQRRLPKRGFNNIFKKYAEVNVSSLNARRMAVKSHLTICWRRIIRHVKDGVAVLGNGS